MIVLGSADLCTADNETRRTIRRIKAAARQTEKARAQREALEAVRR
ncbi:hypothetical protein [Streptomyces poriferorum]|uniref:Uncharacterized protein n=1 Tax=Streptomyces poriferorum TaxID=2798799 RepID=A0ABY9J2J2_9ACTN|nr:MULTISPECIES: hypothetical protein [unclassified Streptomyces]MDP5310428.1 hypothetical protein [Streptomyces sp. Alt4]WLQ60418.1 hypothetical protein P8A19_35565 [Streptomyces sp. Alt2]